MLSLSKMWLEAYRHGIAVALLIPVSSPDATDRHEEKNARTPDVHRVSLCPGT